MTPKQIEYKTLAHLVSAIGVMCALNPEKIIELLEGWAWDEQEAGSIRAALKEESE